MKAPRKKPAPKRNEEQARSVADVQSSFPCEAAAPPLRVRPSDNPWRRAAPHCTYSTRREHTLKEKRGVFPGVRGCSAGKPSLSSGSSDKLSTLSPNKPRSKVFPPLYFKCRPFERAWQ